MLPVTLDNWGDEARALLLLVGPPHVGKKRLTLLALADAVYGGMPQAGVFGVNGVASKQAHYKWLKGGDGGYRVAYEFLIGDESRPGVALRARQDELDGMVVEALGVVEAARIRLQMLSLAAVGVLERGLADEGAGVRLMAANSILDRVRLLGKGVDVTSGGERVRGVVYVLEERPADG